MTEFIHIEPAREQRPAFAAWGLSLRKPLQTASSTGWDVPIDLYPSVPVELLAGAYVDGYPYGRGQVQPVVEQLAAEPKKQTSRKPRKRAAPRKLDAAPRQSAEPVDVAGLILPGWAAEQLDADLATEGLTRDALVQSVFHGPDGGE